MLIHNLLSVKPFNFGCLLYNELQLANKALGLTGETLYKDGNQMGKTIPETIIMPSAILRKRILQKIKPKFINLVKYLQLCKFSQTFA